MYVTAACDSYPMPNIAYSFVSVASRCIDLALQTVLDLFGKPVYYQPCMTRHTPDLGRFVTTDAKPRPPVALPGLPVQYVYDDYWYMYLKKISLDGSVSTTSHLMRLDMALPPCVSLSSCIHPSPIRPFWENRDFP
jgi:hypothetical protein